MTTETGKCTFGRLAVPIGLSIPLGFFLPILVYVVVGYRFLPAIEDVVPNGEELLAIANVFSLSGFSCIGLSLFLAIVATLRGSKAWFWLFTGVALGAGLFMVIMSGNGFRILYR